MPHVASCLRVQPPRGVRAASICASVSMDSVYAGLRTGGRIITRSLTMPLG